MLSHQSIQLYYVDTLPSEQRLANVETILAPLSVNLQPQKITSKVTQKWLKSVDDNSVLIDEVGDVFVIAAGMKVSPNWQNLQQRVVKAGKKTELLLKAMQLQANMTVIDATAGFGHDSLILASTGASVTLLEQQPLMFLLLQLEQQKMAQHRNWQKLMSRLTIYHGDAIELLAKLPKVDRVYLDPMFPADSYKSAVNKHMQMLHTVTTPPSIAQSQQLLSAALAQITPQGVVVVKRPKSAPFLADQSPNLSLSNEIVRFDNYLNSV